MKKKLVTETNRRSCYKTTNIGDIFCLFPSETVNYSEQTDILLTGHLRIPDPWLRVGCVSPNTDCVTSVLQADWAYRTWQVDADANRYRHPVTSKTTAKVNPTFPELLPSLIWPRACAAVTADSHDVGVFLAH